MSEAPSSMTKPHRKPGPRESEQTARLCFGNSRANYTGEFALESRDFLEINFLRSNMSRPPANSNGRYISPNNMLVAEDRPYSGRGLLTIMLLCHPSTRHIS